jgi:hypothetical protein
MADRIDTDGVLHKTMVATGLETPNHRVDLEGGLYRNVDARQKKEIHDHLPEFFAEEAATRIGEHTPGWKAIERSVEHIVALDLAHHFLYAGYATVKYTLKTIADGDELNEAVKRDAAVAVCMTICAPALPEGYRDDLAKGLLDRGTDENARMPAATTLLTTIDGLPNAADVRAGMLANCRDGQSYALDKHFQSAGDVEVAERQNPAFADRYQHDLAFRMGVDSAVWAAAHGKTDDLQKSLPRPVPSAVELRA